MQDSNNGGGPARNAKGQWLAGGASPNARGRPPKTPPVQKSLAAHLAEALGEKIVFTDANGKQKRVTMSEAIARHAVHSLLEMKPREVSAGLRSMKELGLIAELESRARNSPEPLPLEQVRERVKARLAEIKRIQSGYSE